MVKKNISYTWFKVIILCVMSFCISINSYHLVYAEENNTAENKRFVVSIGDSFSSGESIEPYYDQDLRWSKKKKSFDWISHRSEHSWPGMLKVPGIKGTLAENRNNQWVFKAISGAETKHMKESFKKTYYRSEYDVCFVKVPPELDAFNSAENGFIGFYTIYNDPEWGEQRWLVKDCYRYGNIIKGITTAKDFNPAEVIIEKVGDELYITTGNTNLAYHYYRIGENTPGFSGLLKGLDIGDKLTFGTNPFDGQPIEWYIIDTEDDKALLFPVNNLYEWAYQMDYIEGDSLDWKWSSLRESLNRGIMPQAFSEDELKHLLVSDVKTLDANDEYVTTRDIMYLLSPEEFSLYIDKTDYAIGGTSWWLRSPYSNSGQCYFVNYVIHDLSDFSKNTPIISNFTFRADEHLGIRPVVWVSDQAGEIPYFDLGIYPTN